MMAGEVCGCKGIRTCLICEGARVHSTTDTELSNMTAQIWHYCIHCGDGRCYLDSDHCSHTTDDNMDNVTDDTVIHVPGIYVRSDFVDEIEERQLLQCIDKIPWTLSQSGRRKHDFGPKVNFKKKKLKTDSFIGFPSYARYLLDRMKNISILNDFQPVEMCNLEYTPCRGSAIDPHFDDFWLWGERLVTINLLSDTAYTLTLPNDSQQVVKVPLPKRSIIILYSDARFKWMHSIQRSDIIDRRVGITIRELTPLFLDDGEMSHVGNQLLDIAKINIL